MYDKISITKKALDRLIILFSVLLIGMLAYIITVGGTVAETDESITAETQKNLDFPSI